MCMPMSRTTARPDTTDRMVIRIRFDYQQNIHISMYLEEQQIIRLLLVNIFRKKNLWETTTFKTLFQFFFTEISCCE